MFAKVKYLLAIGFLFLIPACATESSTQVANIDSSDEVSVVKEVAEIVNTATPIPPTPKPTNISNNSGNDYYPSWSPDGTKIVFHTTRDGNYEIYTMNSDGTNQTNISNNPSTDEYVPSWSPDGTKIVFTSKKIFTSKIDYMQIFTIKLD